MYFMRIYYTAYLKGLLTFVFILLCCTWVSYDKKFDAVCKKR